MLTLPSAFGVDPVEVTFLGVVFPPRLQSKMAAAMANGACWAHARPCSMFNSSPAAWSLVNLRAAGNKGSVRISARAAGVRASAVQQKMLRPSPAESARTVMEICFQGTLSSLCSAGWPIGSTVQFALNANGNPVFCLRPGGMHVKHLIADSRSSLHTQLDQSGRMAQCTLKGRVSRGDKNQLDRVWERRFGEECPEDHDIFTMSVEEVVQSQDLNEEEIWVSGAEYNAATSDPLKDYAPRIVEDMNKKNWEDILRFCKVYAHLEAEVEQASLTWVDRLGFDMRVLTRSPPRIMEVRIPFEREALDERDARSLLTMMGQIAWEQDRKVASPVAS